MAPVSSASTGAPGHPFPPASPTWSGEFLLKGGGSLCRERCLISWFHAGWLSHRDCTGAPHVGWATVHFDPTTVPKLHTGCDWHPQVRSLRIRHTFVFHMEHGALCPPGTAADPLPVGRVPLPAGQSASVRWAARAPVHRCGPAGQGSDCVTTPRPLPTTTPPSTGCRAYFFHHTAPPCPAFGQACQL